MVNVIFQVKKCLGDDGSQNMSIHQPMLNLLELKKNKVTNYVLSWRSKRVYTSKLEPLYAAFLHSTRFSGYRMRIKSDKDPFAQNKTITQPKL